MIAFNSGIVTCFALSTACATCCWCSAARNGKSCPISAFSLFAISVCNENQMKIYINPLQQPFRPKRRTRHNSVRKLFSQASLNDTKNKRREKSRHEWARLRRIEWQQKGERAMDGKKLINLQMSWALCKSRAAKKKGRRKHTLFIYASSLTLASDGTRFFLLRSTQHERVRRRWRFQVLNPSESPARVFHEPARCFMLFTMMMRKVIQNGKRKTRRRGRRAT